MESLTQTLTIQHRAVEKLVTRIEEAIAGRDAAAIPPVLAQLGTALTAHLKLEDSRLYPEIQRRAEASGQASLKSIGSSFSASMGPTSEALARFLQRYQQPGWELAKLTRDWTTIAQTLATRIRTEESSLYPLYDRLTAQAK